MAQEAVARARVPSLIREGSYRILLAEDDEDVAESVCGILVNAGYSVETCRNGQEALDRLREDPADLILLDLMMPLMDGWEFRALQRADRTLADIPVVVISADLSAKAAAIHAASYLRKPFAADELIAAVERVLLERDRKSLAARLEETERLALLGTLAAEVGHEINNPLSFAMGNLELSEMTVAGIRNEVSRLRVAHGKGDDTDALASLDDKLDRLTVLLQDSRTGAERVRLIVRNLQSLSRRSDNRRTRIDLRRLLDSSISMVWSQIKTRARLERSYAEGVEVLADEARLGQVFLNLLVNASQAIQEPAPDASAIRVSIRTEKGSALVEVEDTGIGMSKALQARIFEPFFTTKGAGQGTGLGLSISRDIVEAYGGDISVRSELGSGSTFTVRLPLWNEEAPRPSDGPSVVSSRMRLRPPTETKSRVWIVDDDPLVAHAMNRMLKGTYDVLVTNGPLDVLTRLRAGETFGVLLCDLSMPGMSGMELSARVASERPELASRVVFISGGAYTHEAVAFANAPQRYFLQKPFHEPELRRAIERALGR